MRMSSRTTAIHLALGMMACTASAEPTAPYATWRLEQFNGGALPAPITIGGTTSYLLADTLDPRAKPGAGSGTGTLVFTMSDGSGHGTRTRGEAVGKGPIFLLGVGLLGLP